MIYLYILLSAKIYTKSNFSRSFKHVKSGELLLLYTDYTHSKKSKFRTLKKKNVTIEVYCFIFVG